MGKTDGKILRIIDALTHEKIIKYTFICSVVWTISPIVAMFLNVIGIDGYNYCGVLLTILYLSGGFGLIFGLIYFYKTFFSSSFERIKQFKYVEPVLLLVVFFLWNIFCTFFADEKRIAIYGYERFHDNLLVYLFYGGMVLCGMVLFHSRKYLSKLAKLFLSISVLLAIVALMNNKLTELLCRNSITYTNGYESVYFETDHYAFCLAIAIVISVFFVLFDSDLLWRVFSFIAFAILTILLVFNATLSAIIALLLFYVFVSIWVAKYHNECMRMVLLIGFLSLLITVILTILIGNISFPEGIMEAWRNALESVYDNPVVGIGPQNTLGKAKNIYFQIAVYTGVPGILIYFSVIFVVGKLLFEHKEKIEPVAACFVFIVSCYLFIGFFNDTMFYTAPYFYFAFGCVLGFLESVLLDDFKKVN